MTSYAHPRHSNERRNEVFLDDVSRQDIEEILGIKSVIIESTPAGLVDAMVN